ncbi:hypothetical protein [Pedobacter sp.]|uniref:hypothetical protein n=1 Tax=Pedobacter sp. TaxID=1411316 RepID=UPI003D7FFD22
MKKQKPSQPDKLYMFTMLKFEVKEVNPSGLCIWCGLANPKNIAHILSKKIIKTNKVDNHLKKSVCSSCNSFFGNEVEDWFYKYSPIVTWAQQLNQNTGPQLKSLKNVPNFLWYDKIGEWIVVNHDMVVDLLGTQLILPTDGKLMFCHHDKTNNMTSEDIESVYRIFYRAATTKSYTTYITDRLPRKFNPRFFLHKGNVIFIGRNHQEQEKLCQKIINEGNGFVRKSRNIGGSPKNFQLTAVHINYRWSVKRYHKLCAKIGFEFLSIIETPDFCFDSVFDSFKKDIFNDKKYDDQIISYDNQHGYRIRRFTLAGWIQYVELDVNQKGFPVISTDSINRHKIFIYEVNGYILMVIQLFNMEPCQLVIAKNKKLPQLYYIEYDFATDKLEYFYSNKYLPILPPEDFSNVVEMVKNSDEPVRTGFFRDFVDQCIFVSDKE